jgi:hypothetical protein
MSAMRSPDEAPSFARQERLRFVESMVLWEGVVRRQRVSDVFGINVNHVTRDLRFYQDQFPGALDFKPDQRGYVAGSQFRPRYASDSPAEYLSLLQAHADSETTALVPVLGAGNIAMAALPSPAMGIDKDVLCTVVRAVRHGHGLATNYLAMNADRAATRRIWPHALINTGLRWYARVFDETAGEFRSLVLARMESATLLRESGPAIAAIDEDWERTVEVHVVPHPDLNAHQQRVVAREFGMTRASRGWVWSITLRRCLVSAFLRRYQLDVEDPRPESHWVILRNPAEVRRYGLNPTAGG